MSRARIVRAGAIASLLGVALVLAGTGYLAWSLVVQHTGERLETLARLASQRADDTFAQAAATLRELNRSPLPPCSAEGIEQMRLLAIDTLAVKAVGYVEEEVFVCSSWGLVGRAAERWPEDFRTREGLGVSINVQPYVAPAKPMLALRDAAFNLLIDPEHFLETSLAPGVSLALGTPAGHWLGTPAAGFAQVLTRIHSEPHTALRGGYLYTRVNHGNWQTVAAVSREALVRDLWRELLMLAPLALLLSGLWCWVVARRVRAYLSPLAVLTRAVANDEFTAFYQPILDLRDGRCIGAEALVRWRRKDGSVTLPESFLPLAESSGLVESITAQVISTVCRDLGASLASGELQHVSINLSALDVASGSFLPHLAEARQQAGIDPGSIWLEVTESCLLSIDAAHRTLAQSREAGHPIALDDFGTGYSSLQYLQRLPLDLLKIDRSFVQSLSDGAPCPVTDHTIAMARQLALRMVAEGVETDEQLQYLRQRGVQYGQGWLFGKAMPLNEFVAYLAGQTWLAAS
ncbi:EAL domain-containing protein [Pseudomonas sp. PDM23]|uniref:EAL domain-containing protein n=1 Tax=unclassified Pseudomonas TaxID=196821 RepID=UPI0017849720|nr:MULTISPECIES: EAL domain-containing protein [unclassified Pseudomonas]MBD9579264.1 EAL domain-containing protein [Pseudomonas sp. PDM23]MBD9672751.1 EAL domain-containing protein [Pseudomonas sp. PDM21]